MAKKLTNTLHAIKEKLILLYVVGFYGCAQQQAISSGDNLNNNNLTSFEYSVITIIVAVISIIIYFSFFNLEKISNAITKISSIKLIAYTPIILILTLFATNIIFSKKEKENIPSTDQKDSAEKTCTYYAYKPLRYSSNTLPVDVKPELIKYNITPTIFETEAKEVDFTEEAKKTGVLVKIKDSYKEYQYEEPICKKILDEIEIKSGFLWLDENCLSKNNIKDIRVCVKRIDPQYKTIEKEHCTPDKNISLFQHWAKYERIYPNANDIKTTYNYEKNIKESTYTFSQTPKEQVSVDQVFVSGGDLIEEKSVCELNDQLLNELKNKTNSISNLGGNISSYEINQQEWDILLNEIHNFQKQNNIGIGPITRSTLKRLEIDDKAFIPSTADELYSENSQEENATSSTPQFTPPIPKMPKVKAKGAYKGPYKP